MINEPPTSVYMIYSIPRLPVITHWRGRSLATVIGGLESIIGSGESAKKIRQALEALKGNQSIEFEIIYFHSGQYGANITVRINMKETTLAPGLFPEPTYDALHPGYQKAVETFLAIAGPPAKVGIGQYCDVPLLEKIFQPIGYSIKGKTLWDRISHSNLRQVIRRPQHA